MILHFSCDLLSDCFVIIISRKIKIQLEKKKEIKLETREKEIWNKCALIRCYNQLFYYFFFS